MRFLRVFILTITLVLPYDSAHSHGLMDCAKLMQTWNSLPRTKFREAIRREYIADYDRDKFLECIDDDAERALVRIIINTYRVNGR